MYVLVVPFLALFSFISVIGMPVGLILAALYIFTLGLGHVFAAVIAAYFIDFTQHKNWSKRLILVALGIWVILKILGFLPVLGWLIAGMVALVGFGTMYQTIRNKPVIEDIVEG